MVDKDIILDGSNTPTYEDIMEYINLPARELWKQINLFIQERYGALPKIAYSKCSAKPGWNMKYQKSGKSLCTLYPEKDSFVALIVITLDLLPIVQALAAEFSEEVLGKISSAKPFNGTLWLMLQVKDELVLDNVKQLLLLKYNAKRSEAAIV